MNIPKKIVVIGGSSAFGKNDIEAGGFAGRLRRWHEEIDAHNWLYNMGIPGDGVDSVAARVDSEVAVRKPDLIILQLGPNDAKREGTAENDPLNPLDEFHTKLAALLHSLKDLAPTLVVSAYPINEELTTPVSWRDVYFFAEDVAHYAKGTKDETLRAGLDYIDVYSDWEAMGDDRQKFMSDDGLHANSEGHEYIFEKVRDAILAQYGDN